MAKVVHHKNGDPRNNHRDNLEVVVVDENLEVVVDDVDPIAHALAALSHSLRAQGAQVTGYSLTYRDGVAVITCMRCGRMSANRHDVAERYCGYCHVFHEGA